MYLKFPLQIKNNFKKPSTGLMLGEFLTRGLKTM